MILGFSTAVDLLRFRCVRRSGCIYNDRSVSVIDGIVLFMGEVLDEHVGLSASNSCLCISHTGCPCALRWLMMSVERHGRFHCPC